MSSREASSPKSRASKSAADESDAAEKRPRKRAAEDDVEPSDRPKKRTAEDDASTKKRAAEDDTAKASTKKRADAPKKSAEESDAPAEENDARAARPRHKPPWASPDLSALTRHAWKAGLAGTASLLTMGYLAWKKGALQNGWGLLSSEGAVDQNLSMAFVLLVTAAVMFAVELGVRLDVERGRVIKLAPAVRDGNFAAFLGECILVYAVELGLLSLAFTIYRSANEYGWTAQGGAYYKPWFTVMPYIWKMYLWGGLPYVLLTRALQHDELSDRKQAAFVVMKLARWVAAHLGSKSREAPRFDRYDRSSILGLFVKLFFVPLMTVFFVDQFSHLVKNFGFLLGDTRSGFSVKDFHNVSYTIVFSVDVGLAWCGYVVSSRWIKNGIFSAEPTALGWMVALASYPPFNRFFGFYFSTPGENEFFKMTSANAVAVMAVLSAVSFTVYTSATVMFGLRFSNLTHRGIITTGPYALVRHPAYAAKNFSWWCVMFPVCLYQLGQQKTAAPLAGVVGLVALSFIYYMRARTEERHLRKDPEYRKYMKKVPYRFIPGVI
ncbi:GTP-binding protein EngA [Minicystis rosea]|nr:GTP-binding protein EngA [Minicystis rosea]